MNRRIERGWKSEMSVILGMLMLLTGCLNQRVVYFNSDETSEVQVNRSYTPVFKPNDFLSIVVTADKLDAAAPFNLADSPAIVQPTNSGYTSGAPAKSGYLLDSAGMIRMPVLGEVNLLGLNRAEATKMIEEKLKVYLSNPIVHIRILNFKVTVLGDVKNPGTFNIPNERITLLEAIGLAGDLNITGNRTNVRVIRNDGKIEKQFIVDLTSQDIFQSEVYYLDQNDVVYVEPNAAARTQSTVWAKTGPFFISISSLIVSTIAVLSK
jgi:polysaccharide export outer membrane protein